MEKLHRLICHISNFELKPLRQYFNNPSFSAQNGNDKLDLDRLEKVFKKWVFKQWRVTSVSGKEKQTNYKKLKEQFKNNNQNLIDFWLSCDPCLTIPPYQSKNNRKPPKCQSLILNIEFLNNRYRDWRGWLKILETQDSDFLENYRNQLNELKSKNNNKYFLSEKNPKDSQKLYQDKIDECSKKLKAMLKDKKSSKEDIKKQKNQFVSLIKESKSLYQDNLDSRVFQFYLDRIRDKDPFKLNRIYACTKKLKQMARDNKTPEDINKQKKKVLSLIEKSKLPESLKVKDISPEQGFLKGSFLDLVCMYYKCRKRAKEGRIFIQPLYKQKGKGFIKTGDWDYSTHLLRYCHLKPRQKGHQLLSDIAHVLQVSPQYLKTIIDEDDSNKPDKKELKNEHNKLEQNKNNQESEEDKIIKWLKSIKGLSKACQDSAKAQKKYKGYLKTKMKQIIKKNKKKDELFKLNECIRKTSMNLAQKLFKDLNEDELKEKAEKFQNPFSFAQIEQIAFKERNGFSKTCKICSYDNALRMELQSTGKSLSVKAQRLPAISTRIIDGAVRKLSSIFANAIAKEKWQDIEKLLKNGNEVKVPLILEQNQFQFEPDLRDLKKMGAKNLKITSDEIFKNKEERIKESNLEKYCPYTGKKIVQGEIDHIIPRASNYGTLNDEANLIYSSKEGNQQKGNKEYSLNNLSIQYKKSLFGEKTDEQIKKWIKEQIEDEDSDEKFKFGSYLNFVNLTKEEQIAFRHALFLDKEDSLHKKVISAIDNRNRSFVNGTQRYFADLIANKLYLIAKSKGLQKALKFDYFGLDSQSNTYGLGINDIRKRYENLEHPDFIKHKKSTAEKNENKQQTSKQKDKKQTAYSHLIDAQIAFILAVEQHKNNGSMGIQIPNGLSVYPTKLGNTFFDQIKIDESKCFKKVLERKSITPKDYETKKYSHRTLWDENPGAWHFLKLIEIKEEQTENSIYLKGFLKLSLLNKILKEEDWETKLDLYCWQDKDSGNNKKDNNLDNSKKQKNYAEILQPDKDGEVIALFKDLKFGSQRKSIFKQKKLGKNTFSIFIYNLNKDNVSQFLLQNFNTKSNPNNWKENKKIYKNLESLWYFTKKQNLIGSTNNKSNIAILDLQKNTDRKNIKCAGFINPSLEYAWNYLKEQYVKKPKNDIQNIDDFKDFLKEHFKNNFDNKPHQKVRKVFSLPIKAGGFYLIKRKNWNKKARPFIYQCQSVKQSSQGGKASIGSSYIPYVNNETGDIDFKLAGFLKSKNIVRLTTYEKLKKYLSKPDSKWEQKESNWYRIKIPCTEREKYVKHDIREIQYKLNQGNPYVRVFFKEKKYEEDQKIIDFLKRILNKPSKEELSTEELPLLNSPSSKDIFTLKNNKPNKIVESYKDDLFIEYKKSGYPKACMKGATKVE